MKIILLPGLILSTAIFLMSCHTKTNLPQQEQMFNSVKADGEYDSGFPSQAVDQDLENILESVKLVTNLSFYVGYDFDYESKVTKQDLIEDRYKFKAKKKYLFERPASGTATVIYHDVKKVALLTCEHIVSSPDTLRAYYLDDQNLRSEYLQSVAIKNKQTNNVIFLPRSEDLRILAADKELDLAILVTTLMDKPDFSIPVYSYGIGKAEELNWGTFVYVIGYPYGKKIISTAIVSNPNRDRKNSFIIDATLHRGVSGGPILALRDGPPNFELVGIASAISGEREYILRPDKKVMESDFEFNRPYEGEIFIDTQLRINYGITYAVSMESIQKFIKKNEKILRQEGYYLDRFYQ